jgi:hypothetical protein
MNVILSHYNSQEIASMFPSPTEAAEFSNAAAEVVVQCLATCESGEEASECSGAAVGLMCHLLITFGSVVSADATTAMLSTSVNCLRTTNNHYVKYSIVMGLVHLFARNAQFLVGPSSPLLAPPPEGSTVSTLAFVLEQWCTVHKKLTSKYCSTISTIGLIELVKLLSLSAANHGIALRVMQLILQGLPTLLLPREGDDEDAAAAAAAGQDDEKGSDDDDEEWDSAEEDYENDDQEGLDDDDEGGFDNDDPFAPAEMYLSDMVGGSKGKSGGDDDGSGAEVYINISDNLVYSPPHRDPLGRADVQGVVIAMLNGLKIEGKGKKDLCHSNVYSSSINNRSLSILSILGFPSWMGALSAEDQHLIEALLNSR